MGFATHLGPWLLGTVKDTTGSAAGAVRNTGCTTVAQSKAVVYTDTTGVAAFALPAGAVVLGVSFITTTTFTAASTIVVKISGTAINTATTITTGGMYPVTILQSQAVGLLLVPTTTDVLVTYDMSVGASSAGAGTLVIHYMVRNADGSSFPATP
jgi:hypothetical protein